MDFIRVTSADHPDFDRAFRLYQEGFPLHEQRTREKQEALLAHPEYRYYVIREGIAFAGILLCWEAGDFIYVEHFAIAPELRGRNLGTRALELLGGRDSAIVLEIDPPEDEVSRRRRHFYERAGFFANSRPHVHPPYLSGHAGHPLVVMTSPEAWGRDRLDGFARYLRDTVMADCGQC